MSYLEFKEVVERSWGQGGIKGWGSFMTKEKLKRLKGELKEWNLCSFGSIKQNIKSLREAFHKLDERDDECGLTKA